jgi:hypothetical protein
MASRENGVVDRATAMTWVTSYERAWRAGDRAAVERLFTPNARYRRSPYEKPLVGWPAIKDFWRADEGETFTFAAEPVAVEGHRAVVRAVVRYGDPVRQEYTDLWLIDFAADGRVDAFEEWAYWPGRGYTADDD